MRAAGSATIGDASGDEAILYNTPKATYDILDNSGIGLGASTASYIDNAGLFEKTGRDGRRARSRPHVTNTGTIEVTAGDARFQRGGIPGRGSDMISGASTLEFDSTVAAGQTVSFTGSGGDSGSRRPAGFAGRDQRLRHGRSRIERHDRGRRPRGSFPASRRTRGARREPWGSPTAQAPSASRLSAITTPPTSCINRGRTEAR